MRALRALVGPLFVVAGVLHFKRTRWYLSIMPDYLPAHRELVYASGVAEIFPANVWMAQHPERYRVPGGRVALIARLPCQAVFIALVRAAMRSR
jgi:uncharacterized membrane protein